MASYTTLVHVHVETALKVSSFVAGLLPAGGDKFEEECKTAINAQNTSQLMAKFLSQQDIIFGLENEKGFELQQKMNVCFFFVNGMFVIRTFLPRHFVDIETLFQAIFSIIYTLSDDTKDTASIISSIIAATCANKEMKPHARLSVAVILFNLIFAAESKCEVLNGKKSI